MSIPPVSASCPHLRCAPVIGLLLAACKVAPASGVITLEVHDVVAGAAPLVQTGDPTAHGIGRRPESQSHECRATVPGSRGAAFVASEGPADPPIANASEFEAPAPRPEHVMKDGQPDWALRLVSGYSMLPAGYVFHGGHFGLAVHASRRFGPRGRGYVGGGPRLTYRGTRARGEEEIYYTQYTNDFAVHQFGVGGDLLFGGGSQRVVGLFSLRLGLGLSNYRGHEAGMSIVRRVDLRAPGGWLLGGLVVLGKIAPRWSLGGHIEAGVLGHNFMHYFLGEFGMNVAWHFGRGRRDGI